VSQGAKPSFLNYNGFPASACISVNDTVIHGIPDGYILKDGDIVSVDVGAFYKGFHGDCAATFACGAISTEAQKLIDVTKQSFFEGIKLATKGRRVQDISHAIQTYVESNGFSIVRSFVGHGIGRKLHEEPEVPNFGNPGRGPRLLPGMTIAVEPMVNAGDWRVKVLKDGWTTVSLDGSLTAHYENTVLITEEGYEVLTVTEDGAYV
jgi:methionyl aminopeptidase